MIGLDVNEDLDGYSGVDAELLSKLLSQDCDDRVPRRQSGFHSFVLHEGLAS